MQSQRKILVVEDELLIAEMILELLKEEGYERIFMASSFSEAIALIEEQSPDLVFTDIALGEARTGIDLGYLLKDTYKIPFIYITSHISDQVINEAKHTFPNAFLTKPFKKKDLLIALEFALHKMESDDNKDYLVTKDGPNVVKIAYEDIAYLKAERNYTEIYNTVGKRRIIRSSLTEMLSQLPESRFLRIHKSYAVNRTSILGFQSTKVLLKDIELPVGRSYRNSLSRLFDK